MTAFEGEFTRISPALFTQRADFPAGWFAVSWRWMPARGERRLGHGRWCKIISQRASIYRILRFSTELEGSPAAGTGQIVLDWAGWLDLFGRAEDVDRPLRLQIVSAKWWAFPRFALAHPDPTIKLAGLLALLSLALGVLSITLTLAQWLLQ